MKRKTGSRFNPQSLPPSVDDESSDSEEKRPQEVSAGSRQINFQSPDFNQPDDLDDNVDNYRNFQALDGIITADMRHHEERKRARPAAVQMGEAHQVDSDIPEHTSRRQANQKNPPPLTIVSKGRVLVVDTDKTRAVECGRHLSGQGMSCILCVTSRGRRDVSQSHVDSLFLAEADSVSVSGGFGNFEVTVPNNGSRVDLADVLGMDTGTFDVVLDLQAEPAFTGKQLPVGYFAPGTDDTELEAALLELPGMKGRFQKPQFVIFLQNRCLHGLSRSQDCTLCIHTCPVAAIKLENNTITIDPYSCQGCGGCALVCPAEAIRLLNPSSGELLADLRNVVEDSLAAGNEAPNLLVHDTVLAHDMLRDMAGLTGNTTVFYKVEDIARMGLDMMLAAIAFGAGSITVIGDPATPEDIRYALEKEMNLGTLLLRGIMIPGERIHFMTESMENHTALKDEAGKTGIGASPSARKIPLVTFGSGFDKRATIRLAIQHLAQATGFVNSSIPLPEGTQFGRIDIDDAACTFCMACAGVCPSGALSASGGVPRLTVVESRCHQCGLCREVCPEKAVRLIPRLLYNADVANAPEVLRAVEPFRCIECGEPFASQAMIERMQEKLAGHWMYGNDRQLNRLRMCRSCRTRDTLMAKDF